MGKKRKRGSTKRTILKKLWKLGYKEYATDHFDVNAESELIVHEGNYQYDIYDLVKRFGTPLEIVFPFIIEERLNTLMDIFNYYFRQNKYRGKFFFHYPMKVNQNKEYVLPVISEGAHVEVASANELWLVKRMWENGRFSRQIKVICNGPKTNKYIGLIDELKQKGLNIVPIIEDEQELVALSRFRDDIGIRLDPDVKTNSHWDKAVERFGFSAQEIIKMGKIKNLKILHYHCGSQLPRLEDIINPARKAMEIYVKVKKNNPTLDTINLGGGFAVPYEKKKMYTVDSVVKRLVKMLKAIADRKGIPHPNIIVEWGRYLVAPAQITIYKIISRKPIPNKTADCWYVIDGSLMNDLIDTWAIKQKWHIVPVNKMDASKRAKIWFAGMSCDSDDKYSGTGSYISLPEVENFADETEPLYVAFFDTGAYQDALASHHCLLSSPAKVIAQNGVLTVARQLETAEEIGTMFGW